MPSKYDAVVIGAGPGGYVSAIRLAQLGKKTLLVEKDRLGGECLNFGCIPSKALISVANSFSSIRSLKEKGVTVSGLAVNFSETQQWKNKVMDNLRKGIQNLCQSNNVDTTFGEATLQTSRLVQVKKPDNSKDEYEADNVIIATGSEPIQLPALEFDGKRIISFKEALELEDVPESLCVIGGGAIGLEMGTMYAKLGTKVSVIEIMDQLLPGTDPDMVRVVSSNLSRLRVKTYVNSRAKKFEKNGRSLVTAETPEGEKTIEAEYVLVSVGKKARDSLGYSQLGVAIDAKGFIKTDNKMMTNINGIFAIGDVTGPPFLAHRASKQGIVAAEVISGMSSEADFRAMPLAIFTDPEVASVGMGEKEARDGGYEVSVGRFPFTASGRALTSGDAEGFVKIVADKKTGRIIGTHIVGPHASDLISEISLAIEMAATTEDLSLTIHPHPTLPETIMEAAEAALKKAIHVVNR